SGAFLLGLVRPGGDALLGATRSGEGGRRPDHARGLLARGVELRLLARQPKLPVSGILRLFGAGSGWDREGSDTSRRLGYAIGRVHSKVRRCARGGRSGESG